MKPVYAVLSLIVFTLSSCGQNKNNETMSTESHPYTNSLIHESSPYLLQHAHNPVNWHAWGEEALEKAKKENKLILVSIGYSACHWCHVMEHETFENEEVARYMNENFIAIKVDREERPDIDQVYMNAVQLLTGRGGWPLNCIALPDGRPIYGGTYFPADQWMDMLKQVSEFVKLYPEEAEEQAAKLTAGIRSDETVYRHSALVEYSKEDLVSVFSHWEHLIDHKKGGYNGAPKFPLPVGYQYLLLHNYITGNEVALNAVTTTLDHIAAGGIYDQIGGGFARYSTDGNWRVPHFEKMLYDNAQLVSIYSMAYQKTGDPEYRSVVHQTLEFIEREMSSTRGGFYSALDADSEGVEGKFYVWTHKEVKDLLGKEAELLIDYYNITEKGNWENGANILFRNPAEKNIAERYSLPKKEVSDIISKASKTLLRARNQRIRPGLDDKVLTAWNGMMIKGYVDAYRVFNTNSYLQTAITNARFLQREMQDKDGRMNRNFMNGKATINGFLDDYAFTISAFIALYQATFDEQWLIDAERLAEYTLDHFFDNVSGMFYYTSDLDPALIARKMEINDNVIPSANSEMAKNLYVLGMYLYNDGYIERSRSMLNNVKENAIKNGPYYANWDILMTWFVNEPYEVAVVGPGFSKVRQEFDAHYLPNVFLLGGKDEGTMMLLRNRSVPGETMIYVCHDKSCQMPVREVNEALKQIL